MMIDYRGDEAKRHASKTGDWEGLVNPDFVGQPDEGLSEGVVNPEFDRAFLRGSRLATSWVSRSRG